LTLEASSDQINRMAAPSSTALGAASGLQRKVKKLLETRTDAPELIESLKALSTFYGENTPAARRGKLGLITVLWWLVCVCSASLLTPRGALQACAQPSINAVSISTKSSSPPLTLPKRCVHPNS
jgi:hypothetical protein